MEEIWKDITGYEGYYQVSNLGRVRSLKRSWAVTNQYNVLFRSCTKEKIIKPILFNTGYLYVSLSKNNIKKNIAIHRLVAEAFIPNFDDFPMVNHIDGNKQNNNVNNLEWCTYKHNSQHAYSIGLVNHYSGETSPMYGVKGKDHPISKAVYKCDKQENILERFDTVKEASESIGVKMCNISECCHGTQKTSGGFVWRFAND